jgi:hypothetical protein
VLRALGRLLGLGRAASQFSFDLDGPPRDAVELRQRLVWLGLDPQFRVRLTSNRTVFVSYSGDQLRIHRAYLGAPEDTWRAIVRFVQARSRARRRAARVTLLAYPIEHGESRESASGRAPEKTHPEDEAMADRFRRAHDAFNRERFGGMLRVIPIRVSRRMRSRLGHYTHRDPSGEGGEIVVSRRHIRRHGWAEAMETLIHEMVHQWQDESRLPVDHGRQFRAKARAVGITPMARRDVA